MLRNNSASVRPTRTPSSSTINTRSTMTMSTPSSSSSSMSTATRQLVNSMITSSRLSKRCQMKLLQHIHSGPLTALPLPESMISTDKNTTVPPPPVPVTYRREPGPMKPGRRQYNDIVRRCDNYEIEPYRPTATRDRTQEIKRLQRIFAGNVGEEEEGDKDDTRKPTHRKPRLNHHHHADHATPIDPLHDLMQEVQERRDFLDHMERLGYADQYRTQIQTEINVRVQQMEKLVKKGNGGDNANANVCRDDDDDDGVGVGGGGARPSSPSKPRLPKLV